MSKKQQGIIWDAHDASIERHERLETYMVPDRYVRPEKKDRIYTFGALLIVGLILLAGFLWLARDDASVVTTGQQTYFLEGNEYTCTFYSDDSMECVSVDDPDIGFGKIGEK